MFNSEFWLRVIIDFILIGIVCSFFTTWFNYKYEKKLKYLEPLTAEETLRRENFLNSKRDVYFEAIDILSRRYEAEEWKGEHVPSDRQIIDNYPTETEFNKCYAKLSLYTNDKEILESFPKLIGPSKIPDFAKFIGLLRKDLGYGDALMDPMIYPYVFVRNRPH